MRSAARAGKQPSHPLGFMREIMMKPFFAAIFTLTLFAGLAAAQDTVTLGLAAPLTGDTAMVGEQILQGAKLAVEHINQLRFYGRTDSQAVRTADFLEFKTAAGAVGFNAKGDVTGLDWAVYQWHNGNFDYYQK